MVSAALDGRNLLVRGTSICVLLVKKVVSLLIAGLLGAQPRDGQLLGESPYTGVLKTH